MISNDWRNQIFEKKKKNDDPNLGQMDKIGPKTKFFAIYSSLVH